MIESLRPSSEKDNAVMLKRSMLIVFLSLPVLAQSRDAVIDQTIAALSRVVEFAQVTISPDGASVAYVMHTQGGVDTLHINEMVVKVAHDASDPAWAPDSKQIAFVSDALQLVNANGSNVHPLTTINASFSKPKWSPDGKKIAVLAIENPSRKGGALVAMTAPSGDVETQIEEQRIAIVDVATKNLQFASPANRYVFAYDWSADSQSIAAEATYGSGDDNYWVSRLYRFDLGNAHEHEIYKPTLQIACPRWSRDGKSIAFIEGLMSDEGATGGDVFVIPASGGAAMNVTPALQASPSSLEWLPNSREILIGENINGCSGFARVAADGSSVTQLWSGEEKVSRGDVIAVSVANDGATTAVVRESYAKPPEVWRGAIGEWKQITRVNESVQPLWGRAESLNWNNDGFRVQGWLLYPRVSSPKLPMVVQVHGGPSIGIVPTWPSLNLASLVASGYAVLMPNPRGSYGQGEAFTQANVKDFGRGDFRDILTGLDAAIANAPIDKNRAGIWGWSYGGYMTMWAVTQTNRFRAAVP